MTKNSEPIRLPSPAISTEKKIPWGRTIAGLLISAVSIYYFTQQVDVASLTGAFRAAKIAPIVWATIVIIVTLLAKAWRWQWLYYPATPNFRPTFRSLMSGHLINLISPIPRLGDVARLYQMQQSSGMSIGQTLGTIVSEKSFDLLLTVLLALVIIPIYNVPDIVSQQVFSLGLVAVFLIVALYFFVYQAERILNLAKYCLRPFPAKISTFLYKLVDRSLLGLAVLKNGRITFYLILLSTGIGILSFLTPLLLFRAFDLPLGIPEALLMNAVLILSISIPSAPGRIGTFEALVLAVLLLFGLADSPTNLAFALVYHAVGLVSTLLIGGWALALSDWKLRELFKRE
ncbi:MAG: lysylphosphatidylglycerol synthase transmembrane domain-containing protein [Anaerolineae bacterium]